VSLAAAAPGRAALPSATALGAMQPVAPSDRARRLVDRLCLLDGAVPEFLNDGSGKHTVLRPPPPTAALQERWEVGAALSIALELLDNVEAVCLELIGGAQQDILFWRQRVGAPLQEWLERGPWGWAEHLLGTRQVAPAEHVLHLSNLCNPLYVVLGATVRSRALMSGMLEYCSSRRHDLSPDGEVPITSLHGVVLVAARSLRAVTATFLDDPALSDGTKERVMEMLKAPIRHSIQGTAASMFQSRRVLNDCLCDCRAIAAIHRRRWGPLRNWHRITIGVGLVAVVGTNLWNRRERLGSMIEEAVTSFQQFVFAHLMEPAHDMIQELLSGDQKDISDQKALLATRASVTSMLLHYYTRHKYVLESSGHVPPEAALSVVQKAAHDLAIVQDIGPAEAQFARETQSPLLSSVVGTLPQLVLMQMSKLRAEALTLMNAMDDVIQSNRFTARMASIMPFLAVSTALLWGARQALGVLVQPIPTDELKHSLLLCLRDIDRLLSLATDVVNTRLSPAEAIRFADMSMHDVDHHSESPLPSPVAGMRRSVTATVAHPTLAMSGVGPSRTPLALASSVAGAALKLRRSSSIGTVGTGALPSLNRVQEAEEFGGDMEALTALLEVPDSPNSSNDREEARSSDSPADAEPPGAAEDDSPELDIWSDGRTSRGNGLVRARQDIHDLEGGRDSLSLFQLGSLEVRLTRFRELVGLFSPFVHPEDAARLVEDVSDLAGDDLSAHDRLAVVQRMRSTYEFLHPRDRGASLQSLFGWRILG
jgi:hypothetical protein